jgi:bifunctional non-homologous end joining protein LigD
MANLGCIEINPWFSRLQNLANPDYLVIDLDPEEISFEKVIDTALSVKEALDIAGAKSFCKTSGATGIHIYVPLKAKYDYDVAKDFAHLIGNIVNGWIPDFTSLERSPSKRKKKVYLDYLQNRKGQTLAAPYSIRPKPGATVSTPLKWEEVKSGLHPSDFTIKNIFKRLEKTGDLFKGVLGAGIDIEKCITVLIIFPCEIIIEHIQKKATDFPPFVKGAGGFYGRISTTPIQQHTKKKLRDFKAVFSTTPAQ